MVPYWANAKYLIIFFVFVGARPNRLLICERRSGLIYLLTCGVRELRLDFHVLAFKLKLSEEHAGLRAVNVTNNESKSQRSSLCSHQM